MDAEKIIEHLIEIKEKQAEMSADVKNMSATLGSHIADDKQIADEVASLRREHQRVKGAVAALGSLAGVAGVVKAWLSLKS